MSSTPAKVHLLRGGLAAWDAASWVLATLAMLGARYDFHLYPAERRLVIRYALAAIVLQLVVGFVIKLYRGRHNVGSFDEVLSLGGVVLAIGGALAVYYFTYGPKGYPKGITLTVPLAALLLMAAGRFVSRSIITAASNKSETQAENVIVYGAGNAGQQLARLLSYDADAPYKIIGFIDDDPAKRNLRVHRAPVLGGREALADAAAEHDVKTVIVAIPTASRHDMRRISEITDEWGLKVLVMPSTKDLVGGRVRVNQLHQLDVADLLGRAQLTTDLESIAGYLNNKVVLVTGAGGSIGSEIARQVYKFGPKELVMLDRDESLLHGVQLSIYRQGLLDTPNMVLCDIRDFDALEQVFAQHRPQVIFHTAALKHLPMLEQYPAEGWKTNVEGSLNLLKLAEKYEVERYVNVSTDKAADATSVLGKTKRLAEELTAHFAAKTGGSYLSVRFGNVLGSRGSALHTFTTQIEQGGPITVTHPEATRFFMTIPEACELVIQAGAIGKPGDVLVLDMGEPVKILELVRGLIARSGKPIDIVYSGLRPNEKIHEVLFSGDEASTPTTHELISRVSVPPLDPATLAGADPSNPGSYEALTHQEGAREISAAMAAEKEALDDQLAHTRSVDE